MQKIAFVSDIHSNLEALVAVMDDIDLLHPDKIICLGDVVGYGPNPVEVIQIAMARFDYTVAGNHDIALVNGANPTWRDEVVDPLQKNLWQVENACDATQLMNFLRQLSPKPYLDSGFEVVHGSFNPENGGYENIYIIDMQSAAKAFRN